jgi:hypothetical protein
MHEPSIHNPLSRRKVLKFGAFTTVGGVLTPGISMAQAITTDTKGIVAREIQLTVGGTAIPAYDARPERAGRYPIVVVISGFTGNTDHNKDVVRRFAQAGFYAIAPELYHREGGMQGKNFQEMGQIAGKVTRAQYLGDIRDAADYAKQQNWARADRLGVTGFCGGGGRWRSISPPSTPASRRRCRGTVTSSEPTRTPLAWTPSAWPTRSRRRCSGSTARRILVSRRTT